MKKGAAFQFRPFSDKQLKVLTWWLPPSPYRDHDGIICDGSIRSGKTVAFIDGFTEWSRNTFSNQNFIVSGKSIGALKRNVVSPWTQILNAKGIPYNYNRSELYIEFGGNIYYLFGANNEASQDVLQGITAAGWLADEVALQPQSFIEQAIGRCSVEGSKYWLNCNPENPYHYVKTDLIDKAKDKHFLRLRFSLEDNLSLSPKTKEKYERMYTGVWYRRFIKGEWVPAGGLVWDMFDENIHVCDDLPRMRYLYIAGDYGTGNPTVFLLCGLGVDGVHYVIDEYRWDSKKQRRQKTDAEYSKDLTDWLSQPRVIGGKIFEQAFISAAIIDPSAASLKAQLRKDNVPFQVKDANNDVVDGIRLVGSLFHVGRLKIHRRCKGLIQEASGYVWDAKASDRGEDKPLKQADHGPDALRYYSMTVIGKANKIVGIN